MSENEFFGGRRRRRGNGGDAFSPYTLFASGEQGVWYDPSDLTPEKVSWRRNLLTYSQNFENAAWTKSNASILSNLALYSQDFENAAWTKTGATITANSTTAPDSTTTADTLTEDTSLGQHRALQALAVTASLTYTMSFYVKANGRTRVSIFDNASASDTEMIFDISNGTVVRTGAAVVASSIVALSNGWYRISASSTPSTASMQSAIRLVQSGTTSSYTGDGTSGIFLWGAQVVPGSTAQTYTRSLATAAPIQFADPLGGTLADKLVTNAGTTAGQIFASPAYAGGVVASTSVYAKAAEWSWLMIAVRGTDGVEKNASFNLSNGTLGTIGSGVTATITAVGSGWYRCESVMLLGAGVSTTRTRIYSANGDAAAGTGDGASGILIFGAQAEQASTASAYQRITDFSSDFLAAFPTHALFQESTGVTPVTALGQSVGLVLDKRLGGASNLGAELVSNGDFSNGSTGWTTTNWIVSGGAAEVINAIDSIAQNISLTAGKTYRVTYTVRSFSGTGGVRPRFFGGTTVTGTTVSSAGTFSEYLVAVTGNTQVAIASTSSTCAIIVDNISVREVPGNHAIQATSAARPTLQARGNVFTYSEQFDNAIWAKTNASVTANATTAPDGTTTADKMVEAAIAGFHQLAQSIATAGVAQVFSVYAKAAERTQVAIQLGSDAAFFNLSNGTVVSGTGATIENAGNGWYRCAIAKTSASANAIIFTAVAGSANYTGDGTSGIFLWGAQLENGTSATTYQRVVTATDYADVGLPRSLLFDGVDDSLATAGNVDFSATDKVSLFSGVLKASDATQGMVAELSVNSGANNGTFALIAPNTPASAEVLFRSRGTLSGDASAVSASYAAPFRAVATGLGGVSTDVSTVRLNGAVAANVTSDQGTGNYGSYPFYVGRRASTSAPFNGRLFQLIIRGAETDSVTVQNAERFVAGLTGVTL